MGWIGRAWRGESPLWLVFWIYGVFVSLLVNVLMAFVFGALFSAGFGAAGMLAFVIAWFVYYTWLNVSVWRCAFNAHWAIWGFIVRILAFFAMLSLLFGAAGVIFIANQFGWSNLPAFFEGASAMQGKTSPEERECEKQKFVLQFLSKNAPEELEQHKQQNRALLERCAALQTRPAPVQPPAADAPKAAGPDADLVDLFTKICTDDMKAHAAAQGGDPERYVAENQAYLSECVAFRVKNSKK